MAEVGLTCMSMHQPWASLVVYGIKRVEGRNWPTDFRGRLWIHATARVPEPHEIQAWEQFYRKVHGMDGNAVVFPDNYPTSVLLGSVEVVDCVAKDDILAWPELPDSLKMEEGSDYGFLCQNPLKLLILHPLKGQPKLWQLPKKLAATASLALKPPPNLVPFSWAPALQAREEQKMLLEQISKLHTAKKNNKKNQSASVQQPAGDAVDAAPQQYDTIEEVQKRVKQLQKKLRQVERIQEKQAAGLVLEPEELTKMSQQAAMQDELQQLLAKQQEMASSR